MKQLIAHGLVPSLAPLELVARAITPPGSPRRFDARFFMLDARHVHGDAHDELAGSGELLDLHWVRVTEATRLDLPDVTLMVIGEVARRLGAPDPGALPVPFMRWSRGGHRLESL